MALGIGRYSDTSADPFVECQERTDDKDRQYQIVY
jgi:hypothetical protein